MGRWRKLMWRLGRTKETRTVYGAGESLEDIVTVEKIFLGKHGKKYLGDDFPHYEIDDLKIFNDDKRFIVRFIGKKVTIERRDSEDYQILHEGEVFRMKYSSVHRDVYDYVPPNFENKQLVDRKHIKYIVGALIEI